MSCNSFSTPIAIFLYHPEDVTFDRPFTSFAPNVPNSYATVSNNASPVKLVFSDITRVMEMTPSTSVAGTSRKVVIEYNVDSFESDKAIQQLRPILQGTYHTFVKYLNGASAWIRAEDSFNLQYAESEGRLQVTITIDTISGIQRITTI